MRPRPSFTATEGGGALSQGRLARIGCSRAALIPPLDPPRPAQPETASLRAAMRTKRTLITGIARQGGSDLAVRLPEKDFEGAQKIVLHRDLLDQRSLVEVLRDSEPEKNAHLTREVLRVGRLAQLLGGSELTDAR